jgi:hypothetical protein
MALTPTISKPVINGLQWDFSSIELRLLGVPFAEFKSLTYKHTLEPGLARGARAQVVGRSRGKYDAEGTIEVYKRPWQAFLLGLFGSNPTYGYMEVDFDIVISYAELLGTVQTDILRLCRIKSDDENHAEGSDVATCKLDLHIMSVIKSGVAPISPAKFIK